MRLTNKLRNILMALGFFVLLGTMFVLNEKQEAKTKIKEKATISVVHNEASMNSVATPVPGQTESALPIKLIYNPNTDFLSVVNKCNEKIVVTNYVQWRRKYLQFVWKINRSYLTNILSTTHNKDIQ